MADHRRYSRPAAPPRLTAAAYPIEFDSSLREHSRRKTIHSNQFTVADGHGVSPPVASHDEYTHRILTAIESGRPVTQRSLSRDLGVALGLTNLLLRRLISKGYVKVTGIQRRRVAYLITPAGIAEKSRVSRAYLENTVRLYTETRERIRSSLDALSATWPATSEPPGNSEKRIVFYGAGEVAEIGYVSLQRTDLRLVGVIDDFVTGRFFGLPVHRLEHLEGDTLDGLPFGRLVIMSMRKAEQMQARLAEAGVPASRVSLLL